MTLKVIFYFHSDLNFPVFDIRLYQYFFINPTLDFFFYFLSFDVMVRKIRE